MKRIVISLAIVLMIPVLFASAVYAQTPASDDEPLTRTELEALLDEYPGFDAEYDGYSGRLPTRTEALEIIRVLESISVTITTTEHETTDNIPPAPGVSGTADAVRLVRRGCDVRLGTRAFGRLVYVGALEHSAQMEVQHGRFVRIVSVPQETDFDFFANIEPVGFSVYTLQGWSDNPYNRRDGSDGWILGSYVTVRARIMTIRRILMSNRDLSCKITSR